MFFARWPQFIRGPVARQSAGLQNMPEESLFCEQTADDRTSKGGMRTAA